MYHADARNRNQLKDLGWPPEQYRPKPLVYEAYTTDHSPPSLVIFHPDDPEESVQSTHWHHLNDIC